MSLVFMDNFSTYGTNKGLLVQGVYAEATQPFGTFGLVADPSGSGNIVPFFSCSQATVPTLRYVLPTAQAIVGWCARMWMDNLPQDANRRPNIINFRDAGNGTYCGLILETTGRITFFWETGSVTTTNPVVSANGWWHLEAKYTTSGAGAFELRVEGIPVITQVGLGYAGHGAVYQVAAYFNGTNFAPQPVMFQKDWVVWNGSGAQNNDFLGSVIVYSMVPNSDVSNGWTLVGGATAFGILDNNPPQDGAQYLTAGFPVPAPWQGDLTDLPPDVTSIKGIQTIVRAAKSDGGDGFLQTSLVSDPTGVPATANGVNRPITVAQTYWLDVFEQDPKTSAPWLPSAANAVNMKIARTS